MDFDFQAFFRLRQRCINQSNILYEQVANALKNNANVTIKNYENAHTFRVYITVGGPSKVFDGISVSVPTDANRFGRDLVYETALLKDDHLVYVDEYGYNDIKRFETVVEIVNEINRLVKIYLSL